jgi:hypothetical protein
VANYFKGLGHYHDKFIFTNNLEVYDFESKFNIKSTQVIKKTYLIEFKSNKMNEYEKELFALKNKSRIYIEKNPSLSLGEGIYMIYNLT